MSDLIIDNVPDDLYEQLCREAEKNGRTVSDEAVIRLNRVVGFPCREEDLVNSKGPHATSK
jgi:Mn-dependent DtxR family transcriptional regulator